MAVGTLLTEELASDPKQPEAPPYRVWEWLVIEALIRSMGDNDVLWGVPGTIVTRRALAARNYLDARGYLKSPSIFGFHGVYKRLAIHLEIVNVHLGQGRNSEALADAWARDRGYNGLAQAKPLMAKWTRAIERSINQRTAKTQSAFSTNEWAALAEAMAPHNMKSNEKQFLKSLLHNENLKALPAIWRLQAEITDDQFTEETLHARLEVERPEYASLLDAIRHYEHFARSMHDSFEIIRTSATQAGAKGLNLRSLSDNHDFSSSVMELSTKYGNAYQRLSKLSKEMANTFEIKFLSFSEPMGSVDYARKVCEHHEVIQKSKSATGKLPWFDRLAPDRIYMRHRYQIYEPIPKRSGYVHTYRGHPIRRFYRDLI